MFDASARGSSSQRVRGTQQDRPRVREGLAPELEGYLRKQIERGDKLLAELLRIRESVPLGRRQIASVHDSPELKALQVEKRNWSRVGSEILKEYFTTYKFAEEYEAKATQPRHGHPSFDGEVYGLRQEIDGELELLRSYLERLPILARPADGLTTDGAGATSNAEKRMNEKTWVRWLNIGGSVASITGLSLLTLNKAFAAISFGEVLGWIVAGMLLLALVALLLGALRSAGTFIHVKSRSTSLSVAFWLAGLACAFVLVLVAFQGLREIVVEFVKMLVVPPAASK